MKDNLGLISEKLKAHAYFLMGVKTRRLISRGEGIECTFIYTTNYFY
jgi:hypothetical protein